MASETQVKITAVINGLEGVKGLSSSVKKLQQATRPANLEIKKLANDTAKLARSSDVTEKELRASVFTMRELRDNTRIASNEYRRFTREIERAEKRLRSLNKTGRSGGKFGAAAAAVGGSALLGADAFAGAGIGAGIGAMFGMPLAGAGAGALAGNMVIRPLREAASGVAEYNAKLNLSKTALAAASDNLKEYNQSLEIARSVSKDYTVDLLDTLDGYSKINAAAKANNLTMEETEDIFRGVISAGVAFGGSQADLQALIRATTQVLSKGKVSAEEMQGQIGERLPGAVAKFAEATGRTLPELSKAFELGEVTIADFVKFSQKQVQTYDEVARQIGLSPEKAGERLKLALDTAKENYGSFFTDIGAGFQDFITKQVSKLNENQEDIKQFLTNIINATFKFAKQFSVIFSGIYKGTKNIWQDLFGTEGVLRKATEIGFEIVKAFALAVGQTFKTLFDNIGRGLNSIINRYQDVINRQTAGKMANERFDSLYANANKEDRKSLLAERTNFIRYLTDNKFKQLQAATNKEFTSTFDVGKMILGDIDKSLDNAFIKNIGDAYDEITEKLKAIANEKGFTMEQLFPGWKPKTFANDVADAIKNTGNELSEFMIGLKAGITSYGSTIKEFSESISDAVNGAFKKMEDTLVNFVMTGKLAFQDLARSIIESMARIAIQQTIMKPFTGWFEGLFNAKGNVLQDGKQVTKYAKGGTIIDKPHYKMMANGGIAVAGEAGSEAILPLKRGRGGRLGVEASGGGIGNIVVNVDAAGTSVSNDEGRAEMLGRMIGMAVESEMLKQKRPGGLLYT